MEKDLVYLRDVLGDGHSEAFHDFNVKIFNLNVVTCERTIMKSWPRNYQRESNISLRKTIQLAPIDSLHAIDIIIKISLNMNNIDAINQNHSVLDST